MSTELSIPQFVDSVGDSLKQAILAIQQPRTDYQLQHFVVDQHDTEPRRWWQCVLELQIKIQNLRRVQIGERQLKRRIAALKARGTEAAFDKAEKLSIDLEDQSLAMLGAFREAQCLLAIYKSFPKQYSRDELNAAEAEYWQLRLTRQAAHDRIATGAIGVGNQDALRMAGISQDVERRFLEAAPTKMVVAVPTLINKETIKRDGLKCLEGWQVPGTFQVKWYVVSGKPIAEAYTDAAETALRDGADFLLCVEDDHIIRAGDFEKLWREFQSRGPRSIVGAWYPQRKEPRTGASIIERNGHRDYLSDDGATHEVFGITQGFTLIPVSVFRDCPRPWFKTTDSLTQDSFFSQVARDAGYRLFVDTSCRIRHVCRETGKVYE